MFGLGDGVFIGSDGEGPGLACLGALKDREAGGRSNVTVDAEAQARLIAAHGADGTHLLGRVDAGAAKSPSSFGSRALLATALGATMGKSSPLTLAQAIVSCSANGPVRK